MPQPHYHTLEEIEARKEELRTIIHKENENIDELWHSLFTPQKASTKGEMVTNLISHSITAFDAFMTVRKLVKNYGYLFTRSKKR